MKIYCIKLILEIIPRNFLYFRLCSKLQSKMAKKKPHLLVELFCIVRIK